MKSLEFKPRTIFVVVKAYPTPSISYGETVCCAGIDLDNNQWIRLYPIRFRDLEYKKRFKKYSIIRAECAKASDDLRPESYRIREDSIQVLDHLGTNDKWEARKALISRLPTMSHCQLIKVEEVANTSLGIIKPSDISFHTKRRPPSRPSLRERAYAQKGLFEMPKSPIEEIPYRFYYHFSCASDSGCQSHALSILDWEIHESFRRWRETYQNEQDLLSKIEERWLEIADGIKNDVSFFVGNLHRLPKIFTVLGVFYPPL